MFHLLSLQKYLAFGQLLWYLFPVCSIELRRLPESTITWIYFHSIIKEVIKLSRQCYVCGKKPIVGRSISKRGEKPYIKSRTKRRFLPNLQRVKIQTEKGNKRVKVCTECLKAGKVQKAAIG